MDFADVNLATTCTDDQLLALDEALAKLAQNRSAIRRFYIGLPNVQAAELLGIPERSAKRRWAYARAWLYEELRSKGNK